MHSPREGQIKNGPTKHSCVVEISEAGFNEGPNKNIYSKITCDEDFKVKMVVITGRASGIGLAFCTRYAKEGAKVILSALNNSAAYEKAKETGAMAMIANVGQEADIEPDRKNN